MGRAPIVFVVVMGIGLAVPAAAGQDRGTVVLLHGLARSASSMRSMQKALEAAGFRTCNVAYPSTKHTIAELAEDFVLQEVTACMEADRSRVHFVTHSMGGILVRYLAQTGDVPVGRVVMLSPPNQGSELVDKLGGTWLFDRIHGPAGRQLGTDSSSVPLRLGPAAFEVGIITGNRSISPINSRLIPGKDDGKVSVERTRLSGMRGFLVLPATHTFIMRNRTAIRQTIQFLEHGAFLDEDAGGY